MKGELGFPISLITMHFQVSQRLLHRYIPAETSSLRRPPRTRGMTSCIAGEHSFCLYGGIQSLQVHIEVPGTIHPIFRCRANLMLPHIKPRFFRQGHQQLTRGCPRWSFHHRSKEAALLSKHGAACVYALLIREVTGVLPKHSG